MKFIIADKLNSMSLHTDGTYVVAVVVVVVVVVVL